MYNQANNFQVLSPEKLSHTVAQVFYKKFYLKIYIQLMQAAILNSYN